MVLILLLICLALFELILGMTTPERCVECIPAERMPVGTDMFWQIWEEEVGTAVVPSEEEAIQQLTTKGYQFEMEEGQ